ncbi:MAG: outer membrane protein assembly factor BamD [Acidobacteria bacterium]|nr:outer membrane protein assembly factor BamD [Acidobacteriota bacterium]MBI3657486.1 outer membrane protein assembly factor BamD [Acidobacteriota bacterium]
MNSRTKGWLVSCLLILSLTAGCREKGAQLQSSATPPDKELFKNGSEWLDKSQFLKARLAFQTLINTYPDSDLAPKSFFNIADSYYEESGKEALLQAETQYKDFMVFYPTHEKTAEAQLKIAALNMKMMEAPDRDATYARRAEIELKRFLEKYPGHGLSPEVREDLKKVQDVLAAGEYGKGQFYYKHLNFKAARSRYEEIVKNYPKYGSMDTVLYELADSLYQLDRIDEATAVYTKLAAGYDGPKAAAAKRALEDLEKPIPPADPVLVAVNNALRPPKASPIKSPVELAAMVKRTFTAGEDPFKKMVERREERLTTKGSGPTEELAKASGEKPKPDISVTIEIPSGDTRPNTLSPPPTSASNPAAPLNPNGNGASGVGPVNPVKSAVKENPAPDKQDDGTKEDPKPPKKKRGLLRRILRTGP